jgi:hypothetical protein
VGWDEHRTRLYLVNAYASALQPEHAPLAQAIEEDRQEDDCSENHRLHIEVDLDEDHSGLHHLHEHRTHDGAERVTYATEETRAAQYRGGYHLEFLADAKRLVESADECD